MSTKAAGGVRKLGPFRIDADQGLLFRGDDTVPLTPKAFDLLVALADEPGRVIAKERLLERVWPGVVIEEGALAKGVYDLRQALGSRPDGGKWIETLPKRGYRLVAVVEPETSSAPPSAPAPRARGAEREKGLDPEAVRLFAEGRFLLTRRPGPAVEAALAALEKAVALEPRYAAAWAAIGEGYAMLGSWESGVLPPREAMEQAHRHSARALMLEPNLADAHAVLAYTALHYDWDAGVADRGFERALELEPEHSRARHWRAHALVAAGRFEEAERESSLALAGGPLDPILRVHLAWHHAMAGAPAAALEAAERARALEPALHWPHFFRGWALDELGDATAVDARRRSVELGEANGVMRAGLARSLALVGDVRAARAEMAAVDRAVGDSRRFAYEAALVHLALGEPALALDRLEEAVEGRSGWIAYLDVDPRFAALRAGPDFAAWSRRVRDGGRL